MHSHSAMNEPTMFCFPQANLQLVRACEPHLTLSHTKIMPCTTLPLTYAFSIEPIFTTVRMQLSPLSLPQSPDKINAAPIAESYNDAVKYSTRKSEAPNRSFPPPIQGNDSSMSLVILRGLHRRCYTLEQSFALAKLYSTR